MTFQGTNNIQWFQERPEFYWYHIEENMKVKGGEGKGQVMSFQEMVLEMTIDHVSALVSQTFKGIFELLTHIGTGMGLDRF